MSEPLNTILGALSVAAAFVGWKGALFLLLGVWFGDYMGRRHPLKWAWLRAGVKQAGDSLKG